MDGHTESRRTVGPGLSESALAQAYLLAKKDVLGSPYREELVTYSRDPLDLSETVFLREIAWVILSAGMAETIIRRKFPAISSAFLEWESAQRISDRTEQCVADALHHFRHPGKIKAIAAAATILCELDSFDAFKGKMLRDPEGELQTFPYIGPAAALHLAKNIGLSVAKPDRHLVRLAKASGFDSVGEFCGTISRFLGEDIRLIDSVLWRFSTIHRDSSLRFSRFMA